MQSRAPLIACVSFLSFLAGLTGVRLAYSLSYVLITLLVIAFVWSRIVGRRLVVTRRSPEGTFSVGEAFEERFAVANNSVLPLPYCEVIDHSAISGYTPSRVCSLAGSDGVTWTARGAFDRRGRHTFGPLEARLGDPFGLFPRRIAVTGATDVLVHPALHPVNDIAPMWSGASAGDNRRGRAHDVAPDVSTVREYDAGDGLSRIHWASTARTGRLMSRTYDTHQSSDILVVLDLDQSVHFGTAPDSTLEYAVSLAASVCHAAIRRGQAAGIVTNDAVGTAFGAGRGEAQRLRILDYLATAGADGTTSIAETITRHGQSWRGRGGLVVVTPSRDPAWVESLLDAGARGTRHLCIVVDPTSFGAPDGPMRISAAWRLALDWHLIRRGDVLALVPGARAAGL